MTFCCHDEAQIQYRQQCLGHFQLNYTQSNELADTNSDLLSTEIDAIKRFITDIEERKNSLYLTEIRSLKDENNELIGNVGFFDALKKII